jgi:hypothetical protein
LILLPLGQTADRKDERRTVQE